MNPHQLRYWLLQQPRPTQLRVTMGTRVELIHCMGSWANVAKSVAALEPELVEALDEKQSLIRATRTASAEDDSDDAGDETLPPPKAVAGVDPETRRFELFARLHADGYKHAAETFKHSQDVAFTKLVELFEASNKRSENLEKSLAAAERIQRKQLEELLAAPPEQQGDLLQEMAKMFFGGKDMTAPIPPTNGHTKPNGKA